MMQPAALLIQLGPDRLHPRGRIACQRVRGNSTRLVSDDRLGETALARQASERGHSFRQRSATYSLKTTLLVVRFTFWKPASDSAVMITCGGTHSAIVAQ